jgi:O-antigen/teichoic acid export membrane protein
LSPLKKLAGQTAIYGLSTIIGRLLNYFLVPLYTYQFTNPADFGVNAEFYAYISFLNIILTYGMETALFNFSVTENDKSKVYGTALVSLLVSTCLFVIPVFIFSHQIASLLHYPSKNEYILWVCLIIALDAITAIPFAKLREQNKAKRFVFVKMVNIGVNIILNLFFLWFCKDVYDSGNEKYLAFVNRVYDPSIGIGYIFIANLVANAVSCLLLLPEIFKSRWNFDFMLWKRMVLYALPLLFLGFAGMINETMDRILLKYLLPKDISMTQVGIYSACYKISILMTIFTQAFKYAAEPFFFSYSRNTDAKSQYAEVMKYFVMICSVIFLATMMNLPWIQFFIGKQYRQGLQVVPILLLANLFLGVFFNLSIWYKLTGKTMYGAYLTFFGAIITLLLNFYLIPRIGYMGSAWATLICYGTMMVASYLIGQKQYYINYHLLSILGYIGLSVSLYLVAGRISADSQGSRLVINNALLVLFVLIVFLIERKSFIRIKDED